MEHSDKFKEHINLGYTFKKDSFIIGTGMLEKEALTGAQVKIPLKTLNRHGLIAGATGTGKTKTLQVIAEQERRQTKSHRFRIWTCIDGTNFRLK